jgi:hypothetical protein
VPLKTEAQIEDAVKYFTDLIQWAGWTVTPGTTCTTSSCDYTIFIKQKLAEKRRLLNLQYCIHIRFRILLSNTFTIFI